MIDPAVFLNRNDLAKMTMMLPNGETGVLTLSRNNSDHPQPGYTVVLRSKTINGDTVQTSDKRTSHAWAKGQTLKTCMDESLAKRILNVIEMKMEKFSFDDEPRSILSYCFSFRKVANEILEDFTD